MPNEEITSIRPAAGRSLWKWLLAAGMAAFLAYGLSAFFLKPTSETIITRPPAPEPTAQPTKNIKFERIHRSH